MADEPDAKDVWRIPISVEQTRSTFLMVRLRADSRMEAVTRAKATLERMCKTGELDLQFRYYKAWANEGYTPGDVSHIAGHPGEYPIDVDLTKAPTDTELDLERRQVKLPNIG